MMNFKYWKARVTGIQTSKTLVSAVLYRCGLARKSQEPMGFVRGSTGGGKSLHEFWQRPLAGWRDWKCLSHSLSQRYEL